MSLSWHQRKSRLVALLKGGGDEDDEGIALDRLTHGQNVIGKTCMCFVILLNSCRDLTMLQQKRWRLILSALVTVTLRLLARLKSVSLESLSGHCFDWYHTSLKIFGSRSI